MAAARDQRVAEASFDFVFLDADAPVDRDVVALRDAMPRRSRRRQVGQRARDHGSGLRDRRSGGMSDGAAADVRIVTRNRKGPLFFDSGPFENNPGSDLLSHAVSHAVPSAVTGLTSVFGMGTGVTLLL